MIDLSQIKNRELRILSQNQERLKIHLDLLEQLQEAVIYGINLIMSSSHGLNMEHPKDRLTFLTVMFAARTISLVRSGINTCCNGYPLESAVLVRSLLKIVVAYEYLVNNPLEVELFHENKISITDVLKRAIKQSKRLAGDEVKDGHLYGIYSDFSHHSPWALSHSLDWEDGDKSFVNFNLLIDDPEIIDQQLSDIFYLSLRFYKMLDKLVCNEFQHDEEWIEQRDFIFEFQDIFELKEDDIEG